MHNYKAVDSQPPKGLWDKYEGMWDGSLEKENII